MTATSRIALVRCGSDGPFDARSVRRTTDNASYYTSLPTLVVEAFNHVVHTTPDVEAVVEISGERLTYAELWERGRGSRWPARRGEQTRGPRRDRSPQRR